MNLNDTSKPLFLIRGQFFSRSGYGDMSRSTIKAIFPYLKDKFNLKLISTRWGGCSEYHTIDDRLLPQEILDSVLREPLTRQPDIFLDINIPSCFQPIGKYNICYTAGLETNLLNGAFIEGCEKSNLNITVSTHCVDVMKNSKLYKNLNNGMPPQEIRITKPIELCHIGVDTNIYKKSDERLKSIDEEMDKIKSDFCFLFVGHWCSTDLFSDRKNIGTLIKSFLHTFSSMGDKLKPTLVLKVSGASICEMDKSDVISRLKAITDMVRHELKTDDLPEVVLLYGDLSNIEMNALYNHPKIRAMLSYSRGEGYGLPMAEFSMSAGKPIIAPNYSGHLDFLNPKYCKLIPGELKELSPNMLNEHYIQGSKWFEINELAASDKLRSLFYHYNSFLENSELLRQENVVNFSIESMGKKLNEILDKHLPRIPTIKPLILPKLKKISLPSALPKLNVDNLTTSSNDKQ